MLFPIPPVAPVTRATFPLSETFVGGATYRFGDLHIGCAQQWIPMALGCESNSFTQQRLHLFGRFHPFLWWVFSGITASFLRGGHLCVPKVAKNPPKTRRECVRIFNGGKSIVINHCDAHLRVLASTLCTTCYLQFIRDGCVWFRFER